MLFLDHYFNVLSNGALVFAVSLILCLGKWIKLFTETGICIQPQFSFHFAFSTQLTEKISAAFERVLNFGIETS